MANTTPIVVTITRTATKEKVLNGVETEPRINILDFCEEHYTDILLVINRIRHDKQREVIKGRAYSTDLAILTRQAQLNPDQTRKIPGIVLMVEAALTAKEVRQRSRRNLQHQAKGRRAIEDFMEQFKVEIERMKGALKCMRISRFMHGVNNPELTKRLNEHVPKTMEEMMIATTAFRRGLTSKVSQGKEGGLADLPPSRTPTKILAARGKKVPATTTYGKLSHLIKEIKQGRDQPKVGKKEAPTKDKSMEIYMIQSWHRMKRQKVTQSFKRVREIAFPSLTNSSRTKGPLVIESKIGRHMIHRMYVDGGSSTEVLYEHCFNQLRPKVKNQMVPATTSLTGFSGETIWPLGQLRLMVTIGDADHSTRAWMNFMIVRSLSLYNGIIRRPRIKEIHVVPSTAHEMLKFLTDGGIVTIHSTILIPAECAMMITSSKEIPREAGVRYENFKVALHPNFPDQEVAIGRTLSVKGRTELCSILKENLDIFAWQPSDMTGVPRSVAEHWLNTGRGIRPFDKRKGARPRNA
nr:reverse transcriptase domain-containing protein [Tanacetum cinerariifolium]